MREKILAVCYDLLVGAGMILGASIAISIAITIPFVAFGFLHGAFCK
jgi:hypothetical protein